MDKFIDENVDEEFSTMRKRAMSLLQQESGLLEVVRLVGRDALSDDDKLKLNVTKSIREDYLQQNAFHDVDTYCSLAKQDKMLGIILYNYDKCLEALSKGVEIKEIEGLDVNESISRLKLISEDNKERFDEIRSEIDSAISKLIKEA